MSLSTNSPRPFPADDDLLRGHHAVGAFDLILCSDGTYLLDGGCMFGVVPKTLWQKRIPADDQNRIVLGLNTTVIRTGKATVLIETGVGNKQSEKMQSIHQNQALLPASLAAAGILPSEITHVINTHLHFDHCGWNTTLHADGSVTPTFPNAHYFVHEGEVLHGRLQLDRDRVSYLAPNYEPLIASGQMTLLALPNGSPPHEIIRGVSVELFPGHTASMLAVHIESEGRHACYVGDLIPTAHHIDPTWVMGYDLDPITCIEQRKRFLSQAIAEEWLVLFTHDHQTPAGTIRLSDKGKPIVIPAATT